MSWFLLLVAVVNFVGAMLTLVTARRNRRQAAINREMAIKNREAAKALQRASDNRRMAEALQREIVGQPWADAIRHAEETGDLSLLVSCLRSAALSAKPMDEATRLRFAKLLEDSDLESPR